MPPAQHTMNASLLLKLTWLGLIINALYWTMTLAAPTSIKITLTLISQLPLLAVLPGILKNSKRTVAWAGFICLAYFIVGVMETWSSVSHALPALIQLILSSCAFLFTINAIRDKSLH